MDIVYIGSSALGLQKLYEQAKFNIIDTICLKSRVNSDLKKTAHKLGHKIKTFRWIKDFKKLIYAYDNSIPFFVYQLDMLVPGTLTKKYNFFNLHRGNLKTNRGPNPDIWPILLGHKTTQMSLHKINHRIDLGTLIDTYDVNINQKDDTETIKDKLEKVIPTLINSMYFYIIGKKKGKKINRGIYRPWITEDDFTINLEKDSLITIERKIKTQKKYNGAIVFINKKKKYVTKVLTDLRQKNKKTLKLKLNNKKIYFIENTKPKYLPPRKFPLSKRI